jgi:hypothetical protein
MATEKELASESDSDALPHSAFFAATVQFTFWSHTLFDVDPGVQDFFKLLLNLR